MLPPPPILAGEASPERAVVAPLDLRLLSDLPSLALQAKYLVSGFLSGRHRSPYRGSSVEFAEFRAYQLGDDLRRIDWRLFGRTDRLHIRQFEDEVQLRVFLGIDVSGSMDFRSRDELPTKFESARILCAALGLLAYRQQDAAGLAIIEEELQDVMRARCSLPHWRALIAKLDRVRIGGGSNLNRAVSDWAELLPSRSIVILFSDFYEGAEALTPALRRLQYDRHEVILVQVLDPMEIEMAPALLGTFIAAESGMSLDVDTEAVRQSYLEKFSTFQKELAELAQTVGGDYLVVRTDEPPFQVLEEYLRKRESFS